MVLTPHPHVEHAGEGPVVLLLHGWGANSELWRPTIGCLRDKFTVIAPDLAGFGRTLPPPVPWGVEEYAQWVLALLDHRDISKATIVGHSNGGRIGIRLAAQWPERVEKLVLTSSAGIRPRRSILYHGRVMGFKATRRLAQAKPVPSQMRSWAAGKVTASGSEDYRSASGTLRATLVRLVNEDLSSDLGQIKAPTLLIWGDSDQDTPLRYGQKMEKLIPDAGLVVFSGAGHFAYLEQSERFCRVLHAFLSEIA
jgi:pimeloyl-ACP methyl ester carboxylesterase